MSELKMCVLGGDARICSVCKQLCSEGYEVAVYGLECDTGDAVKSVTLQGAMANSECIILPLPYSKDGFKLNCQFSEREIKLEEIVKNTHKGQLVCGGKMDDSFISAIEAKGAEVFDYSQSEKLSIMNAIPTSEGAVGIAIKEMPTTLFGSKSCILGYGRIGKVLSEKLKSLGSDVSVFSRKESAMSWCEAFGYHSYHISELENKIGNFDVIFNTIPSVVIDEKIIEKIPPKTVIIDLASSPGGVDFEAAGKHDINVIWALSLPGKTAPVTAGEIIKKCVIQRLREVKKL